MVIKKILTFLSFFSIFCLCGCENMNNLSNTDNDHKNESTGYLSKSKKYWVNILGKNESTINYIVKWISDSPDIKYIHKYDTENSVHYEREHQILVALDMDKQISNFIKKYDILVYKEANIVGFTHYFYTEKKSGTYCLLYVKDKNSVKSHFLEIGNNYYCDVTLFDE